MDKLTVIVTCSAIPSHPSTSEHLDKTLESLKLLNLPKDTPIVLAHDGIPNDIHKERYKEYLDKLQTSYTDRYIISLLESKKGLTGSIRKAFEHVKTDFVLIIQHDLPFCSSFDITKVIEDMESNPELKYIRFNKRSNVRLGTDAVTKKNTLDLFGEQLESENYTYTRTPSWSDNNHICSSDYYRDTVFKHVSDHHFMEVSLLPRMIEDYSKNIDEETLKVHNKYGTYLFGELKKPKVIYHTDGYPKRSVPEPLPLVPRHNTPPGMIPPLDFTTQEINKLESLFTKDDVVLEFGTGWSTQALSKLVKTYNAVEHDETWYERLKASKEVTFNIQHAECDYPNNNVHCEYNNEVEKEKWRGYFTGARLFEEKYYNKVFIDGRARVYCAIDVLDYIDKDSLVIIHDFGRTKYYENLKEYYDIVERYINLGILRKK